MTTLESSVTVHQPASVVAAFVLDWGNDHLWRSHVHSFTCTPTGRAAVGQRLVEELRFAGLTFVTPTVVEAADDLSASYSGGSSSIEVSGRRVVVPKGTDRCEVRTTTRMRVGGLLRPFTPLLTPPTVGPTPPTCAPSRACSPRRHHRRRRPRDGNPMSAVLLPGQAAAPEGPADLTMMYVLHHGFRRDLARFVVAVQRTPRTELPTWVALLERCTLRAPAARPPPQGGRVRLAPLRAAVSGDPKAVEVLDAMEAEHATIDPLLAAVRGTTSSTCRGPPTPERSTRSRPTSSERRGWDEHLGHEERDAIGLLQRYVAADDWAELERTRLRGGLGPGDLLRLLPWSVQDLPGSVADDLLAEAGLPFRVLLRLGRRRYERLDSAAFAHVPAGVGP